MSWIVYVVIAGAVVALFGASIRILRPYERGLVERLGKYHRTLDPGVRFILPVVDRIIKVDMRERVIDVPPQNVITADNVGVTVDAVVYNRVTDPVKVSYNVEDFEVATVKLAQTNLRNQIGDLNLDDTLTSRERINAALGEILDEATDKWGVKVTRVEIQRIDPPEDILDAMSQQMKAERVKRAKILEAEGDRQSNIERAEGSKQASVLEAEGEAEAMQKKADAERYQQVVNAEGEAEAIHQVYEAIHEGRPTSELITIKYLESLGKIADGQATKVFMPLEASGVLGGLASVLEGATSFDGSDGTSGSGPGPKQRQQGTHRSSSSQHQRERPNRSERQRRQDDSSQNDHE